MAAEDVPDRTRQRYVIFEDNELYQNNLAGIRIRGSMPVTIKTCEVYSNGEAGIVFDNQAQAIVTGCNVFQNGRAGIDIEEAVHTTIENSRIYENSRVGVRIWKGAEDEREEGHDLKVRIAGSRIYSNNQAGIRSMPTGDTNVDLAVVGNDIYQNDRAGIRVENHTNLTAKENNIYENGTAGIISSESVVPPKLDIYQNSVSFNRAAGIHVINGITGRIGIRNNWIINNDLSGIACGVWSDPDIRLLNVEIINNTIVSNGSSGPLGGVISSQGEIFSGQGAGIRNDSKGKAIVMNNIVAYNYIAGIMTKGCHEFSYNLLFANGDVGNCCEDAHSAPNWIESQQFGGCWKRGRGDLIADPLFVDPDNYNFYLQDESPAIDAGSFFMDTSFPPSKGTNSNDMGATGGPWAVKPGR
jgi:parallel beta-helix repeat protein